MKIPSTWRWEELRHRLVLTSEEKRVVTFVIAALLLGVGTKHYREGRPKPPLKVEKKHAASHPVRPDASPPSD
ncbi:MAG TPA: hypothetical protein VKS98_13020 [Chthoniobacterales bacterium]|nr:hypothetical protein [Chthoniobacterales bacterium]